jgi:hypothetical protein
MPELPPSAVPNAVDLARGLLGRLNAEHAGEPDLPAHAERLQASAPGTELRCAYDAEPGWWSVEVRAAAEPARREAKLTRQGNGRWRLWLARGASGSGRLIEPCAIAVELVEALRLGRDAPEALARDLAARRGAHISLAAGRLAVTAADGRRCRGLLATGAGGSPTLFLLDGDAWTGGAGRP